MQEFIMKKVVKFGGSSLASAEQFKRSVKSFMQMIAVYMLFLLLREKDLMEILR